MIPVYCISLESLGRREKIAAELAKAGYGDVTYVYAKEPSEGFACNNMRRNARGEFGCALSHLKAIVTAISDGVPEALFVEDDVVFRRYDYFEMPEDWQVFYYGGHPRGPVVKITENVYRVGLFSCAEAYLLKRESMLEFVQFWCDRAGQPNAMFDFILGEFAAQGGGYALYPTMTHQPPGYSQIGRKFDDKTALLERGWKNNLA
jgi:hypothetical protein